jgi:hypothetical protein
VIRPERKSDFAVWPMLSNKPLVLVGRAIDGQPKLFAPRVRALNMDKDKGKGKQFMDQCIPNKRRMETVTNEALTMIKTD